MLKQRGLIVIAIRRLSFLKKVVDQVKKCFVLSTTPNETHVDKSGIVKGIINHYLV